MFCKINGLFTLPPHLPSSLIYKRTWHLETLMRCLFWGASLPSSWSAGSPNSHFPCLNTSSLGFIGLSCGELGELGLGNKAAKFDEDPLVEFTWNASSETPPRHWLLILQLLPIHQALVITIICINYQCKIFTFLVNKRGVQRAELNDPALLSPLPKVPRSHLVVRGLAVMVGFTCHHTPCLASGKPMPQSPVWEVRLGISSLLPFQDC